MENHVIINSSTTLSYENGKLGIVLSGADLAAGTTAHNFFPMSQPSIYSVERVAGAAGASRTQTWTPVAANNTLYAVTILVYKENDWGFFGPELSYVTVNYTSDASATVAEITAGITAAINAVGSYWGITATDGTTLVTITSNTAVPQNIDVLNTGTGSASIAQTVAYTKPYGLASYLQALGLDPVAGSVYTSYTFMVNQPSNNGRVGSGSSNVCQTVWCVASGAMDTALAAWQLAPMGTYTLERE